MLQSTDNHSLGGNPLNTASGRVIQSRAHVHYSNISNQAIAMSVPMKLNHQRDDHLGTGDGMVPSSKA